MGKHVDGFQSYFIHDVTDTAAPLYLQLFLSWLLDMQEDRGQAMLDPEF